MKKKKLVVDATYFGDIRRCVHLSKGDSYSYINSELVSKNRMLLKTTNGKYITGSDYVDRNDKLMDIVPTCEGELYVDVGSLVPASVCLDDNKIKEKSLHL